MAVNMNKISIYTVKFFEPNGPVQLEDFQADGQYDAEQKWRAKYPHAILVNTFRKQ